MVSVKEWWEDFGPGWEIFRDPIDLLSGELDPKIDRVSFSLMAYDGNRNYRSAAICITEHAQEWPLILAGLLAAMRLRRTNNAIDAEDAEKALYLELKKKWEGRL